MTEKENRQVPIYRKNTNTYHFAIMQKNKINRGNVRRPPICKRCGLKIEKGGEPREKGKPYHQRCFRATQIISRDD